MKSLTIVRHYESIVDKANDYVDFKFNLKSVKNEYFLLIVVDVCESDEKGKLRLILHAIDENFELIDKYFVEVEAKEFDKYLENENTLDIVQESWENLVKFPICVEEEISDAQIVEGIKFLSKLFSKHVKLT